MDSVTRVPERLRISPKPVGGALGVVICQCLLPLKSALRSPNVSQPHIIRSTYMYFKKTQDEKKRAKGATKGPTGMITEFEFITHPPRRLRSQSRRYGMLSTGVPGVSKFSREEALPALVPVNSA